MSSAPASAVPHLPFPPPGEPRPFFWTRDQYHRMGTLGFFVGRRVELVNGEVVEMSPKGWPHVVGCRKTADALDRAFAGTGWVSRQEPVVLLASEPEPDVAVLPGRFEDYTGHPETALLIVEVADTTLDYDTTTKAELYATAGVADYWVVDLAGRRLLVFRDPRPVPDGGAAYRRKLTFGPDDAVAPLAAPAAVVAVAGLLP